MSSTRTMLAAVLMGLSAGPALAQPDREKEPDAKQLRQMYEDVAVFRTLLNRSVVQSYGLGLRGALPGVSSDRQLWTDPKTRNMYYVGVQSPYPTLLVGMDSVHSGSLSLSEGVYLPGQGVVFNVTAPIPLQDPLAKETGSMAKEMSPWERARRELRGDKVTETKTAAPRQASLSEALLRLLAENGRHFKELGDNERITVALTFRGSTYCASCHASSAQKAQKPQTVMGGGGAGSMSPARNSGDPDQSTVGDLHWRQGRYKEAIAAYELTLKRLMETMPSPKGPADLPKLLSAVELANKLTRAFEACRDGSGAQRWRDLSLKFAKAALELSDSLKGKPVEKGTIAVPPRLIVSASKKLLEQAGSGKMTFEEFRKAATVQHLRFPKVEK